MAREVPEKPRSQSRPHYSKLITHTMPLADINKGFDLMEKGESIRGVVVF